MSIRSISALQSAHVSYAQAGSIFVMVGHLGMAGHIGGHSGGGAQDYIELLAGDACGNYTSANSTLGTRYFDDIEYFVSFKNLSLSSIGGGVATVEVSAESLKGDNYSRNGIYDPDGVSLTYLDLEVWDEVFGRFNRIALFKTGSSAISGRLHVMRGPARTLVKENYGT